MVSAITWDRSGSRTLASQKQGNGVMPDGRERTITSWKATVTNSFAPELENLTAARSLSRAQMVVEAHLYCSRIKERAAYPECVS
jgi:hypothetical protein